MERVQDERWEFDLDIPRSEERDPLRRWEVAREWRRIDSILDSGMRERERPSGLVRR